MYIETTHNNVTLEHYVAHPETITHGAPSIILFHTWSGRDQAICDKAQKFAESGHLVVALDLYGKGVLGRTIAECQSLMNQFIEDRYFLRKRIKSILDELTLKYAICPSNSVAIGYCFGGLCVLDTVRNNFGFAGAISVHGKYDEPSYETPKKYSTKTLIMHGMKDPIVTMDKLNSFIEEFSLYCDDFQIVLFSNGLHGFADKNANDPSRGTQYNEKLDARASHITERFINECVGS